MTGEDPPDEWHEQNPLTDETAAELHASGVYTTDGGTRDRGIFTRSDREYIIGQREYKSPQHRSNVRRRHIQRVLDSLNDFQLLLRLDDRTRERIFDDAAVPWVHQTLRDLVRFFYEGIDRDEEIIEDAVESAIWESEAAGKDGLDSVNVDISIEQPPDPETAKEMLEAGDHHRLTLEQIGVLARDGLLTGDDWEKLEWPVPYRGDSAPPPIPLDSESETEESSPPEEPGDREGGDED